MLAESGEAICRLQMQTSSPGSGAQGLLERSIGPPPCPSPPLAWRMQRLHHILPGIQPPGSAAGRWPHSGLEAEPCSARRAHIKHANQLCRIRTRDHHSCPAWLLHPALACLSLQNA